MLKINPKHLWKQHLDMVKTGNNVVLQPSCGVLHFTIIGTEFIEMMRNIFHKYKYFS